MGSDIYVGEKVAQVIVDDVSGLIREQLYDMNEVYSAEGSLTISISVKLAAKEGEYRNVDIDSHLTYSKGKVKVCAPVRTVNEQQLGLF